MPSLLVVLLLLEPEPLDTTIVMVDPEVAEVADCEMTLPFATVLLVSVVTETPKPAFLSAVSAEDSS